MKRIFQKLVKPFLAISIATLSLVGCGVSNNVLFSTTNGQCPNGQSNAPYCMSVQIQNNGGGQNWITSTNFPISGISMTVTGASNVQTPSTNQSTMDPNNCIGSTIAPGSTCTFYMQLNGEAFPVDSQESIQVNVSYTINNTLFGNSNTTSSTSFTVYELTNLYVMQNNSNVTIANGSWSNYGLIESANTVAYSMAMDTNSYGLLYMSNNFGLYTYSISNNITSSSLGTGNINGANNLFTNNSGNLYVSALASGNVSGGVYSWSFSGESWNSSTTPSCPALGIPVVANANAMSITPVTYLTTGGSIYACTTNSGTAQNALEGSTGLPSSGITSLAFSTYATLAPFYSGLFAGTSTGLFVESGVSPSPIAYWNQVSGITSQGITTLAVVTESGIDGVILAGGTDGKIWSVFPSTQNTASLFAMLPSTTAISAMAMDTFGDVLYVSAGNAVYACIADSTCTAVLDPLAYTNSVVGMGIGSFLTNTLSNPYNNGSL